LSEVYSTFFLIPWVYLALTASPFSVQRSQQFVCVLLDSSQLAQSVQQVLSRDALQEERYTTTLPKSDEAFFSLIEQQRQDLDRLIFQNGSKLPRLIAWLHDHSTLLPTIVLEETSEVYSGVAALEAQLIFFYHSAEIRLPLNKVAEIAEFIDQAIDEFLNLSPSCRLPNPSSESDITTDLSPQNFLLLHQRRLTEKLKERLGYLGIYYKRNPKTFLRCLPLVEREQLLSQLRLDYRAIVLNYFMDDSRLNQRIDDFVNTIFFADIPVAQIVEIHMELMDDFTKQLKLEGRSEDILLDYRLTLIDTIAHLCEMYRRSIPRES
jgi:circadian clock protein KaiA